MPVNNICECEDPPGGRVVCEPHQMAICGVVNGAIRQECLDPPKVSSPTALVNWALEALTGIIIPSSTPITYDQIRILFQGSYENSDEETVKFILPESIIKAATSLLLLMYRYKKRFHDQQLKTLSNYKITQDEYENFSIQSRLLLDNDYDLDEYNLSQLSSSEFMNKLDISGLSIQDLEIINPDENSNENNLGLNN